VGKDLKSRDSIPVHQLLTCFLSFSSSISANEFRCPVYIGARVRCWPNIACHLHVLDVRCGTTRKPYPPWRESISSETDTEKRNPDFCNRTNIDTHGGIKMQSFKLLIRFFLVGQALLGLSVSSVNASLFTYHYTGNTYDHIAVSPYNSSMTISGTLTFDLASITDLAFVNRAADITSFSLFDGVDTIDKFNSTVDYAAFSTDSSGAISIWDFQVGSLPSGYYWGWMSESPCFDSVLESGGVKACSNQGAGTFTGPSAVPVPAAIWLFGSALIGLVGLGKRKSKVAVEPVSPNTF